MKRLLKDYNPIDDSTVGGIPVDSEYIICVIDTSGSMYQGPWNLVIQKITETLSVYPRVKGIQVLNGEGEYSLGPIVVDGSQTRLKLGKILPEHCDSGIPIVIQVPLKA